MSFGGGQFHLQVTLFIVFIIAGLSSFAGSSTVTLCLTFRLIQNLSLILLTQTGKNYSLLDFCFVKSDHFIFLNRFVQYKQTSLEKNFKHDLLTELDLGVNIDLINPDTYEPPEQGILKIDEEDDRLLEDEVTAPTDTKRSRCHNRTVTWLKKTEYIATEFNRYGTSNEKTETKYVFTNS